MTSTINCGRSGALRALSGEAVSPPPVALFTWEFDYLWKAAGLEPWQLACGDHATLHRAHLALLERHRPDLIWYSGAGFDSPPRLVEETSEQWIVENNGRRHSLRKDSLTICDLATGRKGCDPVGELRSRADIDRLIPEFKGWDGAYLDGLRRLIGAAGDRALVLPHFSPGYICACYAFGFERAMVLMAEDPELFLYACERYRAGDGLRMREWKAAGAEVCFIADGWASCDIISPAMFDRFALPYQSSMIADAHAAGLKIILWNEGDVMPILDREAALPLDAFQTEQARKGVDLDLAKVRAAFGPKRCLLGNLDSEGLLKRNDPGEIGRAVRALRAASGAGAPFIMNTGSPIPSDVEPAAVDAMIRAAREGDINTKFQNPNSKEVKSNRAKKK